MRPLTPNEKFLLFALGLIAFAGLNFFGYRALSSRQAAQKTEYAGLKADQTEARISLKNLTLWQKREAWIVQHEPKAADEGDAKAGALQTVAGGARQAGLQVVEQSVGDTAPSPEGFRIEMALTVKGPMEALSRWLAGLQDPASFYAVPYFSLKADEEKKMMVCTLHLQRSFRKGKS